MRRHELMPDLDEMESAGFPQSSCINRDVARTEVGHSSFQKQSILLLKSATWLSRPLAPLLKEKVLKKL